MKYAYPMDELRPLSCEGVNSIGGGNALTLLDSLTSVYMFERFELGLAESERSREYLSLRAASVFPERSLFEALTTQALFKLNFATDTNASVFEVNIRYLGALVSVHELLQASATPTSAATAFAALQTASDLALRLLPAFSTATGVPFGTVHMQRGVPSNESTLTCLAGGGSFLLEFSALSAQTGDRRFSTAARSASLALWRRRSRLDLLGNHIDVHSGRWSHPSAQVGSHCDSFYEYLWKGALLLDDSELHEAFFRARRALLRHSRLRGVGVHVPVHMDTGVPQGSLADSLQAFWAGTLVESGRLAAGSMAAAHWMRIWRRYGALPELMRVPGGNVEMERASWPLRPELVEALYYLERAEGRHWGRAAAIMFEDVHRLRVPCGVAERQDVRNAELGDHMNSFFLAETLKYFLLIAVGKDGERDLLPWESFVFNTEAHPLPLSFKFRNLTESSLRMSHSRDTSLFHCPSFNFASVLKEFV